MDNDSSLGLLFFALALLYFVTLAIVFMRMSKFYEKVLKSKRAMLFYGSIALQTSMRGIFFLVIFTRLDFLSNEILFLLISLPDSAFLVSFMVLAWQFIAVFYYSHIDSGIEERYLSRIALKPQAKCSRELGLYLMCTWVAVQGALYCVYFLEEIDDLQLKRELGISNLVFTVFALTLMVVLQIAYSGSPIRTEEWRDRLKLISWVMLVWTVGRALRGAISLAESFNKSLQGTDIITGYDSLSLIASPMTITCLIVSELVCYYVSLDANIVPIIIRTESTHSSNSYIPLASSQRISIFSSYIPENRNLLESELSLDCEIQGKRHALGTLKRGSYKGKPIVYRKIEFSRLSGYVLEELADEVDLMPTYECDFLVPVIGVVTASPCLGIVTPYMSNGSLSETLNSSLNQLTFRQKIQIMSDVAQCLKSLHAKGLFHGHLSSHNILLDKNLRGYVSDYGLHKVKKYAGLTLGYCNKTSWSSPEQLKERSMTVIKATSYDDVYSFGIVLWEIMTGQVPFPGYSRKQLTQKVSIENYRPQIPDYVPEVLADLIKACWNTEATLRPDFELIEPTLLSMLAN
mmetsp:Transcript_15735/g.28753  ORF Transcript_15735/g.28753 Transcript_15735/m.28753 type:complete len:575 (+) Transcript_15735:1938-3662(+)